MSPEFWLQVILGIGAAIGVYAGIRADLATTRARADQAVKDADKAHERLDDHLNLHHGRG